MTERMTRPLDITFATARSRAFAAVLKIRPTTRFFAGALVWFIPAVLCAQEIVEGGSPLYERAVTESVKGLVKKPKSQAQPAAGQVCKSCGKVHPPGQHGTPQPAGHVSTPGKPCPKCGKIHAPAKTPPAVNHVDSGAKLPPDIADKYYYCKTCKAYHLRKETPPGKQAQPKPAATVHIDSGIRLPAGAASRYYYCETCEAYHLKSQIPPTRVNPKPLPPPAARGTQNRENK